MNLLAPILGGFLASGLLSVIGYRMARRGRWLALPWVVSLGSLTLQTFGVWVGSRQGGVYVDWAESTLLSLPGALSFGNFVMLIALAIAGPRLKSAPQVEASDANS